MGPASKSWVAVGTGSEMAGSMMFIAYSDANGQSKKSRLVRQGTSSLTCDLDVTLSPRISPSHNEPQYSKDIDVSILAGTGITNGTLVVIAHCRNCKTWNGGSLDFSSRNQAWIYAIGPSQNLKSNSPSASISQHDVFGIHPMSKPCSRVLIDAQDNFRLTWYKPLRNPAILFLLPQTQLTRAPKLALALHRRACS